ncbi:MAG: HDIG domain-containing protein [Phycisphaerales bacterium]|nr:HDIG domain-containing protein [Phycisphaerales bacterium]
MTRDEAMQLVRRYVANEALVRHMLAVEAAMGAYADRFGGDEATWRLVGLLHDFDYERWPTVPDHTREGAKILREHGVDEEIVGAILSHADWNTDEYPRDTPLRKTLFAVDELCGFIHAVALVRPARIAGMGAESVLKKMKTRHFAAAVSREDIVEGAELLGVPLNEHIETCITAMSGIAGELGLA